MADPRRTSCTLAVALTVLMSSPPAVGALQTGADKKPSLSLKATPQTGFSPLRVTAAVDARGGSDDYADFYCASIEWDWGDDTKSESSSDCEPYEAGKSTIRRRFTANHVYRQEGSYRVVFRLKQKTRVVGVASTGVQVRPGLGAGPEG